jgi:hypothetical protein
MKTLKRPRNLDYSIKVKKVSSLKSFINLDDVNEVQSKKQ